MECAVAEVSKAERLKGKHETPHCECRLKAVAGSFRRSGLALAASASAFGKEKLNSSRTGWEDWPGIQKQ